MIILKFIINIHNYQLNVYYNYNDNQLYIYIINRYYIFKFYYLCQIINVNRLQELTYKYIYLAHYIIMNNNFVTMKYQMPSGMSELKKLDLYETYNL